MTITQYPSKFSPAYNELVYVVTSSNQSQPNYKYICDIYAADGTTRLARIKRIPQPDGYGMFDLHRILENYVHYDIDAATVNFEKNSASGYPYIVKFGEEYGSDPTGPVQYLSLVTEEKRYVFNSVFDFPDFLNYNQTDWLIAASVQKKFLTNAPIVQSIRPGTNAWLHFMTDTNVVAKLVLKTYNSSGTLLSTYSLTNTQIGYMSAAQVQELVNSQLANLTSSQLKYVLGTVMSNQFLQDNLSTIQRNSINEIYTLQTGQTTSYATGDDGNLQHGRLTDFFTLKTNNSFGNTHRFTDENGAQVFGSNYVIDHATGLGWCTTLQTSATWATAIANTLSLTVGANTYNDFKLPNANEVLSITQYSAVCLNYAPFNLNPVSSAQVWSSTTNYSATTAALRISYQTFPTASSVAKSATQPYLLCRKHF